jgi:hypothetical protein
MSLRSRIPVDGPEPPVGTKVWAGKPHPQCPSPWPRGAIILHHPLTTWWRTPWRSKGSAVVYSWTNGDRRRPWLMLGNRTDKDYVVDIGVISKMHRDYSRKKHHGH